MPISQRAAGVLLHPTSLPGRSWAHFTSAGSEQHRAALAAFERDNKWLPDWALFATLKERHAGAAWTTWPEPLAARDRDAIAAAKRELAEEIRFHKYVQW